MRSPVRLGRVLVVLLLPSLAVAVQPRFELTDVSGSPFPSDRFTIPDGAQVTNRRVEMPVPDCRNQPSDCEDLVVLNELDGFNVLPRIAIPFDGQIDVNSITRDTLFLLREGAPADARVEIEEVLWDPDTLILHGRAAAVLDQHARFLLVVTRGVLDATGRPIDASAAFRRFRHDLNFGQTKDANLKAYRKELLDALDATRAAGIDPDDVAVASAFTTLSATAVLERAREAIYATPAPHADFDLLGSGVPEAWTVFRIDDIKTAPNSFVFNRDINPGSATLTPLDLTTSRVALVRGGAVGSVALGRYESPNYLDSVAASFGPLPGTRNLPIARGTSTVYFNLFLPAEAPDRPRPAAGWPVVLFAYGSGDSKNGAPFNVASVFAEHGLATLSINAPGHGLGPRSTLTVDTTSRGTLTIPSPARGVDQDGNGTIGTAEGFDAGPPRDLTRSRDAAAQTGIDLLQLIRILSIGVDVNGDGTADLDPSRIFLLGFSTGGGIAASVHAVEAAVFASAFNSPGFTAQGSGLSPLTRSMFGAYLATRDPPLVNGHGLTVIDGVTISGLTSKTPLFNENAVWRYEGPVPLDGVPLARVPVVNTIAGAIPIQDVFERMAWACQAGGGLAPWPLFRKNPLDGIARPVMIQFTRGDQQVFNPNVTRFLRSGDLADRATFVLYSALAGMKNPHTLVLRTDSMNAGLQSVAKALQTQVATFFESAGSSIISLPPTAGTHFEVPVGTLPETLNYIP